MNETNVATKATSWALLSESLKVWRANLRTQLHISLVLIVVPQFALLLISSAQAQIASKQLWSITNQYYSSNYPPISSLLAPIQDFLFPFGLLWLMSLASFCIAYAALLDISVHTVLSTPLSQKDEIVFSRVIKQALKMAPKILGITILLQVLFVLGMQLIIFHMVAIVLGSIAPVIMFVEQKGVFASLKSSLLMSYTKRGNQSSLSMFFNLAGAAALVYLATNLIFELTNSIPTLDMNLGVPRSIFQASNILGIPFPQILSFLLNSLMLGVLISFVACMTVCFYFAKRKRLAKSM